MNPCCASCGGPLTRTGETLCVACRLQTGLATAGELYAAFIALPPKAGSDGLEALCAAHPQHAGELRRLHEIARSSPRASASLQPAGPQPALSPPPALGWQAGDRYHVEGVVARGGMGIIYSVRDRELNRQIAMKVIGASSADQDPLALEHLPPAWVDRFVEEAQITAQLDHPGIVPVHEVGLDPEGRLYFTMKLVRGRNLGEVFPLARAKLEGWNLARAVRALLQACQAVAYAHEHGVVHRDLKPDNIMVGRLGEVFVMDWGVAHSASRKDVHELRPSPAPNASSRSANPQRPGPPPGNRTRTEDSPLVTLDGTVLGTPAYMSPEHALGNVGEIGPWSDVYSLGAVIYQLLGGHPPYAALGVRRSPRQLLEAVRAGLPEPIEQLARDQPAELVAICTKAMDRDRRHRYPDAGALAEDLQAWLDRRVVRAHQTGALAELKAWIHRNQLAAFSQAAAVILLVTGLLGIIALQNRASRRIAESNVDLRDSLYRAAIFRASQARQREDFDGLRELLDRCEPDFRGWEWHHFQRTLPQALTLPPPAAGAETRVVLSHDDRRLVGIDWDGTLKVWDARDGTPKYPPLPLKEVPYSLALSPDDTRAAVGHTNGNLSLLELETHGVRWTTPAHALRVGTVHFSPDGTQLVSGSLDATVALWETATGRRLATARLGGKVYSVSFSPDGRLVAACATETRASLLAADTFQVLRTFGHDKARPLAAAFSPDGTHLATADSDGQVRLWDSTTGQPIPGFATSAGEEPLWSIAWSPDGRRIASAARANLIRVQDARTGGLEQSLRTRARGWLPALQFSQDSRQLLASAEKGGFAAARLWNLGRGPAVTVVPGHQARVWSAAFTPDSRRLMTAGFDGVLNLVDAATGEVLRTFRGHTNSVIWSVAVTPDGRHAVSGGQDGTLRVWDLETGTETRTLRAQPYPDFDNNITLFVAVSPDGHRAVSGGVDGRLQLWDLASGERVWSARSHTNRIWSVAWSPDGRRIGAAGDGGQLTLWESTAGRQLWHTNGLRGTVGTVAFAPDGPQLLTAAWIGELRLWDSETGRLLARRAVSTELVRSAAFSPDGRRIACAGFDRRVTLWDTRTLEPVLELPAEPGNINFVAFSPDGRRLVSCNTDHQVRVWQTE